LRRGGRERERERERERACGTRWRSRRCNRPPRSKELRPTRILKALALRYSLSLSLSRFHFLLNWKDWGRVCGVLNSLKVKRSAVKRVWMEEGYLKDFSEAENSKSSFCCLLAPLSLRRKGGTLDQRFEHVLLLINYSSKYLELEVFRVLSLSLCVCFLGFVLFVLVFVFSLFLLFPFHLGYLGHLFLFYVFWDNWQAAVSSHYCHSCYRNSVWCLMYDLIPHQQPGADEVSGGCNNDSWSALYMFLWSLDMWVTVPVVHMLLFKILVFS
jgi:hypothetical protein